MKKQMIISFVFLFLFIQTATAASEDEDSGGISADAAEAALYVALITIIGGGFIMLNADRYYVGAELGYTTKIRTAFTPQYSSNLNEDVRLPDSYNVAVSVGFIGTSGLMDGWNADVTFLYGSAETGFNIDYSEMVIMMNVYFGGELTEEFDAYLQLGSGIAYYDYSDEHGSNVDGYDSDVDFIELVGLGLRYNISMRQSVDLNMRFFTDFVSNHGMNLALGYKYWF